MKTLILVPTFNAQSKILDTLSELEVNIPDADILVVDHGSTDRTKYILKNNDVSRLIMPLETSYYHALSLGMKYAHKNKYDIVIEWDDKGKFNPIDIKYFVATIARKKVDMVLGSRFVNEKPPRKLRWSGTRSLRRSIKMATGKVVTDPTLRFRAYGKKAIKFLAEHEDMGPAPDTIAQMLKYKYTYVESLTHLKEGTKKQLHDSYFNSVAEIFRWTLWIKCVLLFKSAKEKKKVGK